MHGWVAYSHQGSDEAPFRGKLALVVGLGTVPYAPKAHVQVHAYVSIYSTHALLLVLRACYYNVFELHFPEAICHLNSVPSVKYFSWKVSGFLVVLLSLPNQLWLL